MSIRGRGAPLSPTSSLADSLVCGLVCVEGDRASEAHGAQPLSVTLAARALRPCPLSQTWFPESPGCSERAENSSCSKTDSSTATGDVGVTHFLDGVDHFLDVPQQSRGQLMSQTICQLREAEVYNQ